MLMLEIESLPQQSLMEGVLSCSYALLSENIFFWKGSVSNGS